MKKSLESPIHRFSLFLSFAMFFVTSAFQQPQQTGGASPWLWVVVLAVLVFVIALLFIRGTQQTAPPPPTSTRSQQPAVRSFQAADDLTIIEGIGPKIAQILIAAGITTFSQLSAMDASRIQEIVNQGGIRLVDTRSWAEQARLAAAGDQAGLKALQDRLTAGRKA